jgi:hypothetical protein
MDKKEGFFHKYQIEIQGIASIVQAATVVSLLIITLFYTAMSQKTTDLMTDEFHLSNRPYITLNGVSQELAQDAEKSIVMSLELGHRGQVPGTITAIDTEIMGGAKTADTKSFVLFPGDIHRQELIFKRTELTEGKTLRVKLNYKTSSELVKEANYCVEYYLQYNGIGKQVTIDRSAIC